MSAPLSGPGVGLQVPQFLYPSEINPINTPYDYGSNQVTLNAGDQIPVPAGTWYISLGNYLILEFLDPITGVWQLSTAAGWNSGYLYVKSDGFNFRIANRLGCPVGGVVTQYGGGWVQASTTVAVTGGGGSTWQAIVGGQLAASLATIGGSGRFGAGYGVPPILIIPPPPSAANNSNGVGGVQASGYVTIANGTVSGVTLTNPGAGYPTAPAFAALLPNPTDPNLATGITMATIGFSVTGSGSITGLLCTNPGNPLTTPANITLTPAGVGTNATLTPVMLQTVTAVSLVGSSTIGGVTGGAVTSQGGAWPTGTITNSPPFLGLAGRPRPVQAGLTVGAVGTLAAQVGTLIDGGLFYSAPTPILQTLQTTQGVGSVTGSSTVTFVMGSRPDIAILQPAP